jgi:histidinol phosphatase-like enzyme (inositol monophosphatase family)
VASSTSEYLEFALHLAQLAGKQILPHFRTNVAIEDKSGGGLFDPVTRADRDAEAAIRAEIQRVYPDHGILGEEQGLQPGASRYTWIIDPIDGTRAFVLGQLHWGTLIALNDGERPVVGVMRQHYTGEAFVGALGRTALLRAGQRVLLSTRKSTRLADVFLCATDPTMFSTPEHRAAFDRVGLHARAVRFGGDCYTPCLVAAGSADLVIERGLKPWDIQALIPIVEGAGGVITDWTGARADHADAMVVASNPALHAEVIALLNARD